MLGGILLYDQLLFRPLLAWANKFKFEESRRRRSGIVAADVDVRGPDLMRPLFDRGQTIWARLLPGVP